MEGGGGGGGGELNLAAAWAGWQEAQLGAQTARLTEQAQAVLQRIEETRARRKVLAAETKRFRADAASVPEALLVKFSALVQSYQREVDHLTHRAKAAESEFLKLFKTLREQVRPSTHVAHHERQCKSCSGAVCLVWRTRCFACHPYGMCFHSSMHPAGQPASKPANRAAVVPPSPMMQSYIHTTLLKSVFVGVLARNCRSEPFMSHSSCSNAA